LLHQLGGRRCDRLFDNALGVRIGGSILIGVFVMDGTIRVRTAVWFATAVVLSVFATLLVSQEWRADAAPGDSDSTFVPTAGCRVTDTRGTSTVGPRNTPLGANQSFTVAIHGSNGECTGALEIPTDAVGVALNVTAVNATASSNIRIFPADLIEVPELSNLNVSAGAPPTPNKVDVKLSPDGEIKVYNFNGSVNIVIDIVGYYTNETLKEIAARLDALEASGAASAPVLEIGGTLAACSILQDAPHACSSVIISAPVDGKIVVSASGSVDNALALSDGDTVCSISDDFEVGVNGPQEIFQKGGTVAAISLTRGFPAIGGESYTYRLLCETSLGNITIRNLQLTALFVAN
jgi:hypothetical protein